MQGVVQRNPNKRLTSSGQIGGLVGKLATSNLCRSTMDKLQEIVGTSRPSWYFAEFKGNVGTWLTVHSLDLFSSLYDTTGGLTNRASKKYKKSSERPGKVFKNIPDHILSILRITTIETANYNWKPQLHTIFWWEINQYETHYLYLFIHKFTIYIYFHLYINTAKIIRIYWNPTVSNHLDFFNHIFLLNII